MLNYAVLSRGDRHSNELTERFHQLASERGFIRNDNKPDKVISIGGDGTLLQAFHTYLNQIDDVAFVGVHTGHLGFYADWKAEELDDLVGIMAQQQPKIVRYPLAQIELETPEGITEYIALNRVHLEGRGRHACAPGEYQR